LTPRGALDVASLLSVLSNSVTSNQVVEWLQMDIRQQKKLIGDSFIQNLELPRCHGP
jgi:hypothetical protein